MIIGTAGHIDHGKTALVRALTGVQGDRLKEEKARGITIDLGFAYLPQPGGATLGFVDVPGHERFVHTMLAGAAGIDFVLLVIAADDGVMPQTREHLAILDLLGVSRGLVVLTKADLAGPARLAELSAGIGTLLAGTCLAGAEVLPVSAVTGAGIDALRARLLAAAAEPGRRPAEGAFRMAIDRVFTLTGIGTVATGTVLGGSVRSGDRLVLGPSGIAARVRSLHVQNSEAALGGAGDRCALGLQGERVSRETIRRGDMALAPGLHAPTDRLDARLRLLPGEGVRLRQWLAVRLHHAATEVGAHLVLLDDAPPAPGAVADVQIVLDRPIAAAALDRFVIRDGSARRTIGGGVFLDLRPPARRRRSLERQAMRDALAIAAPAAALAALLNVPPGFHDLTAFVRDRALPPETVPELAAGLGAVLLPAGAARFAALPETWQAFTGAVTAHLAAFHADNPDLQGIGRERLRLALPPRLAAPVFAAALGRLVEEGAIAQDGAFVRLAGHVVRLTAAEEEDWEAIAPHLGGAARFRPPRVRDIAGLLGRNEREIRRLLKLTSRLGRTDEVAPDHVFLRETVREMLATAGALAAAAPDGRFTAAAFRDRLDNGRKVAIHVLEFYDRHGVTLNRDDMRRVNWHRLDLFGPLRHCEAGPADRGRESSPVGRSDFKSE